MPYNEEATLRAFSEVLRTVARLRGPGGCPWDREQTHHSLRKFLIEETYEVTDVLDRIDDPARLNEPNLHFAFREEWGDLLLQILLHAEIATETNPELGFEAIAKTLNEKLIRRHPHVFGETTVSGTDEVLRNWDELKKKEKKDPTDGSLFDSIPKSMPPLPRTEKIIAKVTKAGFQWPDLKGPLAKLEEEVSELRSALENADLSDRETRAKVESEIGDVLFSVANVAFLSKINPDEALRSTLNKFESRFRHVENRLRESGKTPESSNLEEMDRHWDEAKRLERGQK